MQHIFGLELQQFVQKQYNIFYLIFCLCKAATFYFDFFAFPSVNQWDITVQLFVDTIDIFWNITRSCHLRCREILATITLMMIKLISASVRCSLFIIFKIISTWRINWPSSIIVKIQVAVVKRKSFSPININGRGVTEDNADNTGVLFVDTVVDGNANGDIFWLLITLK